MTLTTVKVTEDAHDLRIISDTPMTVCALHMYLCYVELVFNSTDNYVLSLNHM